MRVWLQRTLLTGVVTSLLGGASTAWAGVVLDPPLSGQRPAAVEDAPAACESLAAPGQPEAPPQSDPKADAPATRKDGRRTLRRFPANFLRGAVNLFSADNVKPLLIGGAATGIGALFDDEVADAIADPEHNFGQAFEGGAHPAVFGAAVTVLFAVGRTVEAPRFRDVTYDWMEAYFLNAGLTNVLKLAVGRERPNGEDNKSFPSGHASTAFTLAAVAERHFGWKVGVPAYMIAGAIAVSRLQRNKHYLSDVMAGATLGYIVGRTVVRANSKPLEAPRGPQFSLTPMITRHGRALVAGITF
jgi:membrane-associated phospholipid phosphatase